MLEAFLNAILVYHFQLHNKIYHLGLRYAGAMSFRGANVTWCNKSFRVHFIGWWMRVDPGQCQ